MMKTILFALSIVLSQVANASGWMTIDILPGSVFTSAGDKHIAIMREQKSLYPSENYECKLVIEGDISSMIRDYDDGTNWDRSEVREKLAFTDSWTRHEEVQTEDRSSECLEWGPYYEEEGRATRDCIRYENYYKTVVNIIEMRPINQAAQNLSLEIHCEKWMSQRVFTNLDNFFHAMYKSKGNLPLFLDLELD